MEVKNILFEITEHHQHYTINDDKTLVFEKEEDVSRKKGSRQKYKNTYGFCLISNGKKYYESADLFMSGKEAERIAKKIIKYDISIVHIDEFIDDSLCCF